MIDNDIVTGAQYSSLGGSLIRFWLILFGLSAALVAVSACSTDNITEPATLARGADCR